MFYAELKAPLEAILFVSGDPVPVAHLADVLQIDRVNVEELIDDLQNDFASQQRGLTIIKVAGGYQLCTKPEFSSFIEKITQVMDKKLSAPAMETLSIIESGRAKYTYSKMHGAWSVGEAHTSENSSPRAVRYSSRRRYTTM